MPLAYHVLGSDSRTARTLRVLGLEEYLVCVEEMLRFSSPCDWIWMSASRRAGHRPRACSVLRPEGSSMGWILTTDFVLLCLSYTNKRSFSMKSSPTHNPIVSSARSVARRACRRGGLICCDRTRFAYGTALCHPPEGRPSGRE